MTEPTFKAPGSLAIEALLSEYERSGSGHGGDGHGDKVRDYYVRRADEAAQGISSAQLAPLRGRFGARVLYESLVSIGEELRIPPGGAPGLVLAALEARAELAALNRDPEFSRRFAEGDQAARDRMIDITERANPRELDPMVLDAGNPQSHTGT